MEITVLGHVVRLLPTQVCPCTNDVRDYGQKFSANKIIFKPSKDRSTEK